MIKEINTYQNGLHLGSAMGLIFCKSHENLLNKQLISQIAINILFGVLSFTGSSFTALPIALSLTTIALLACNVSIIRNRYLMQQEALILKPIFESVLKGEYKKSLEQFNTFESRLDKLGKSFHSYYTLFPVPGIRGKNGDFFAYLGWTINLMNCFLGNNKTDNLKGYCFRLSDQINKKALDLLKNNPEKFEIKITKNYSELLLAAFINQLQAMNQESIKSLFEEGAANQYLEQLLNYGENFSVESLDIIKNLSACKNIQEMHQKALPLKTSMSTPVERFS